MSIFLVGNDSEMPSPDDVLAVSVPSKEHALAIWAEKRGAVDPVFLEYLHDHAVNMSFAEQFWLATDEENRAFVDNDGEILATRAMFEERVRRFFGERQDWADLYLKAWATTRKTFKPFPSEMILFAYVHSWLEDVVALEINCKDSE